MAALGTNMTSQSKKKSTGILKEMKSGPKPKSKSKKDQLAKPKKARKSVKEKPSAKKKTTSKKSKKVVETLEQVKVQQPKTQAVVNEPKVIELNGARVSIIPSKRRTIRKTRVVLEGTLTVRIVKRFNEEITPVFSEYDYIDFYLKEVQELDLSLIQLLNHLKVYYADKGKVVTVDAELTSGLKKIVVQSGFENLMFIPKLV